MTVERRVGWIVGLCALCAALALGGLLWVGLGQQHILSVVEGHPQRVIHFEATYAGADGDPYRVAVDSETGEPLQATVARFDAALLELERSHPRRR